MSSYLIKNFSILFSGNVLQKIIGLAALSYYARYFSAEEIAIIPLYSLVANLSMVAFGFGIQAYIMKSVPALLDSDVVAARYLIKKILRLALFASVACGFSFLILIGFSNILENLGGLTVLGLVAFALGASFECLNTAQREILAAARYVKKLTSLGMIKATLWPPFIILFYIYFGPDGIVLGLACVSIISFIITRIMLGDLLIGNPNYSDDSISVWKIIRDSWPFYLEGALMVFRRQGDMLVIILLMGAEMLGIYYIAKRLGELIWTFVGLADPILTPELSIQASKSFDRLKNTVELLIKTVLYIVIPVSLVAACGVPLYILIVSGNKFEAAILPAIVLSLKPITEVVRLTIIGRTVLVCCRSTHRLYMTLTDIVVLLPVAVIGAMSDSLSLVAAAPIISGFIAGALGYYFLNKRIGVRFPAGEVTKLLSIMLISLYTGYLVFSGLEIGAYGAIVSMGAALGLYFILFINIVDLSDFTKILSKIAPQSANSLADLLLKFRVVDRVIS